MFLYFDESGDFAFPSNRFDAYTQAVLICPDSKLSRIEEYVDTRKAAWDLDELHATDLDDEQVWEICRFIRTQRLPLLVQATDTNGLNQKLIESHRLDQAARFQSNFDWWREAGGVSEELAAWYAMQIKRAAYPTRPNNSEWVQSDLLIALIPDAINKTIAAHLDERWRDDFCDFRFIFDGKLPGKLAAGEKQLQKLLLPALGSNPDRFTLLGIQEWRDPPVHPFEQKYSTESGTVDLRLLFEHGLEFEPSHSHAGLQLVDVVAYVARRRIVWPDNETIRWAWQTIRPILLHSNGAPLNIHTYRVEGEAFVPPDDSHYADM